MDRRIERSLWGAALSGGLGLAARQRGALTGSGAVGALLTGTAVVGGGGWDWGAALVYFFASSSALSRVAPAAKARVAADKFAKGGRRDLAQALANGGVAATLAVLRATPWGGRRAPALTDAFVGALAAANADTWATEVGILARRPPRLITSGRTVPAGTSGGVTALGSAAALAGALTLGAAFALARRLAGAPPADVRAARAALAGGVAGSLVDSLLGATAQAMYRCPRCGVETERRVHGCGAPTLPLRGLAWLDNDGVNTLATLAGAATGALAGRVRGWPHRPDGRSY